MFTKSYAFIRFSSQFFQIKFIQQKLLRLNLRLNNFISIINLYNFFHSQLSNLLYKFVNKETNHSKFISKSLNSCQLSMSQFDSNDISQGSSVETFAPVAVYRLKYYQSPSLFDQVLYMLIRPPRFVYNQRLLIPGRKYQCKFDYQVHNIPFPLSIYWAQNPKYIILYLHGNSSSRFEGYLHLKQLPQGACLACFDFNGCGLRKQGKFITLGKQQSQQVDKAVSYLQKYGYPIVGWGRSMGAVSLLMSSKCQIMIADSPFSSLYDLCKQTSLNFVPGALCCLVHCLFPCLFCCVRSGVQKYSGMDPNQLQIIKAIQRQPARKNILIMAGKDDSMIHFSHSQKLHDAFKGQNKRLIIFQGTHNSSRPAQVFEQCFNFIQSSVSKYNNEKTKITNPSELQSPHKVFKMDRDSSKASIVNNYNSLMSEMNQMQSSKETLVIPSLKGTTQLKPLKISVSKSSPKKLSKIEQDTQINNQVNIQINQSQSLIRQGIGKFEQNLQNKQKNLNNKISFKTISKKNEIQSESGYKLRDQVIILDKSNELKIENKKIRYDIEQSKIQDKQTKLQTEKTRQNSISKKLQFFDNTQQQSSKPIVVQVTKLPVKQQLPVHKKQQSFQALKQEVNLNKQSSQSIKKQIHSQRNVPQKSHTQKQILICQIQQDFLKKISVNSPFTGYPSNISNSDNQQQRIQLLEEQSIHSLKNIQKTNTQSQNLLRLKESEKKETTKNIEQNIKQRVLAKQDAKQLKKEQNVISGNKVNQTQKKITNKSQQKLQIQQI